MPTKPHGYDKSTVRCTHIGGCAYTENGELAGETQEDAERAAACDTPADALDPTSVGALLIGTVASSDLLRHYAPRNTAQDYLHPQTPEEQFVVDVLTRKTEYIVERWFGGSAVRWVDDQERELERVMSARRTGA